MKKTIALTLIVVLIFVAMTACSSPSKQASGSSSAPSSSTSSTDGSPERIEFEYYSGLGGVLEEGLLVIVDRYNASQNQYTCKVVSYSSYDEAYRAFQAASAAKQPPALVMGDIVTNGYEYAADVLQFSNEYPGFSWDDYIDGHVEACMVGGRMVGLPIFGGGFQLFYDKHKVAELGLDPAVIFADWNAVREMSLEVTEKDANGDVTYWGFSQLYFGPLITRWALANGGKVFTDDLKTATVNTKEWVEVWDLMRTMIHEEEIMQFHHGGQGWEAWYKTIDDVLEGRALAAIGSSGDFPYVDWDIVDAYMPPKMRGQAVYSEPTALNAVFIPEAAPIEQQRAAFDFYVFFSAPENGIQIATGIGTVPSHKGSFETPEFKEFLNESPYFQGLIELNRHAGPTFIDPTSGKINDILTKAYDRIMIEGIPAQQALDDANVEVQRELDLL